MVRPTEGELRELMEIEDERNKKERAAHSLNDYETDPDDMESYTPD